jgi:arylsulfatase A-like enzyme
MKRRCAEEWGVGLGVAAGLLALALGCNREAVAPDRDPAPVNVLLVTFDALRADAVSYDDAPAAPSPRLAELAADGVAFSQAVSSFIGTTPAMPSLMSGLWPSFEGIADWNGDTWNGFWDLKSPDERGRNGLTARVTMLAERLRHAGFATAGFNTNPFLGKAYRFNQGFDHYEEFSTHLQEMRSKRSHDLTPTYPPADVVTRSVNTWLDRRIREPFFLWIHLMEPHSPYLPPAPYDRAFPDLRSTASDVDINKAVYRVLLGRRGHPESRYPSPEDLGLSIEQVVAHARSLYAGSVRFADEQLGALVERLRSQGLLDRTLLVVTADHGEEFLDHGSLFHELYQPAYEELLRVPLLIRFPDGTGAGTRVDRPVRMVDVAPTILEAVGLGEQAAGLDGAPLQPLLAADDGADRTAFMSAPGYGIVRTAAWKLRVWKVGGRPDELYRIEGDPRETADLAEAQPEVARELRARWDAHAKRLRERSGAVLPRAGAAPEVEPETRRQLEALGYTDP